MANIAPFIKDVNKRIRQERALAKAVRAFARPPKVKKRAPLEKATEQKASKAMREDGAEVAKLNLMGQKAWPDRLIAPPGVKVRVITCWTYEQAMEAYHLAKRDKVLLLIEYKREGAELTELQRRLQRRLMFGIAS